MGVSTYQRKFLRISPKHTRGVKKIYHQIAIADILSEQKLHGNFLLLIFNQP
jgi:hypothetical protein